MIVISENCRKLKLLFISLEMDHIEIGREGAGDECVAITTIINKPNCSLGCTH
jgi:hypothetical protein